MRVIDDGNISNRCWEYAQQRRREQEGPVSRKLAASWHESSRRERERERGREGEREISYFRWLSHFQLEFLLINQKGDKRKHLL